MLKASRRMDVLAAPDATMNTSGQEMLVEVGSKVENGFSARLPRNMKGVASEVSILGRAKGVC